MNKRQINKKWKGFAKRYLHLEGEADSNEGWIFQDLSKDLSSWYDLSVREGYLEFMNETSLRIASRLHYFLEFDTIASFCLYRGEIKDLL